jgi:hypothetical protein
MPWPESLEQLLARPDSHAAQALRWGMRGLRASLQAVLDEIPEDPGSAELRRVLDELGTLLEAPGPLVGASLPVEMPASQRAGPRLLALVEAVGADGRFREILRGAPLRTGSDEEIWNDVQRLLLRAPPDLAAEWRQRCLALAEQVGARADAGRTEVLPLTDDGVVYPGLTGAVEATGLRTAPSAALDPRMAAPADGELRVLAGLTSAWLWFTDRDPHLHHCLAGVFRFGVPPLTGDQRQRYVAELLRRWERVRAGAFGARPPKEQLKERLDLDEALHSLVYQPSADPGSWWGRLLAQARDTLLQGRDRAVQAGCHVHLQLLGGSFAEINRLAPDSLEVDYGIPGEVVTCLRAWARIDGEELKGRVLYRPPREETDAAREQR